MLISPDLVILLLGKLFILLFFLMPCLNSSQNIRFLQIWTGLGGALGMHFTKLRTQVGLRRAFKGLQEQMFHLEYTLRRVYFASFS